MRSIISRPMRLKTVGPRTESNLFLRFLTTRALRTETKMRAQRVAAAMDYLAYGLRFRSDIALPCMEAVPSAAPDVIVRWGEPP